VDRFGETSVAAEHAGERVTQLGNAWETFKGELGDVIVSSQDFNVLLEDKLSYSKSMPRLYVGSRGRSENH